MQLQTYTLTYKKRAAVYAGPPSARHPHRDSLCKASPTRHVASGLRYDVDGRKIVQTFEGSFTHPAGITVYAGTLPCALIAVGTPSTHNQVSGNVL